MSRLNVSRLNAVYLSLLASATLLIFLPIFFSNSAFWDEAIGDYAIYSHNFNGVDGLITESNWFLLYPALKLREYLSRILHINQHLIGNVITLIFFILFILEVKRFCRDVLKMSQVDAAAVSLFVSIFPVWHILFMSWFQLWLFGCFALPMAYRLIKDINPAHRVWGYVLLALSFQLNSNFFFLFGIIGADLAVNARSRKDVVPLILRAVPAIIVAVVAAVFLVFIHPSNGLYKDYNKIILPFGGKQAELYIRSLSHFADMLVYIRLPLTAALIAAALAFVARHAQRWLNSSDAATLSYQSVFAPKMPPIASEALIRQLVAGALLFVSAIVPYVIVGKFPLVWYFPGWEDRHAVLLAMPLGILAVVLIRVTERQLAERFQPFVFLSLLAAVMLFNVQILIQGISTKLTLHGFQQSVIEALKASPKPEPGVVQLVLEGTPKDIPIDFYNLNWLFVQAYGEAAWYVVQLPDRSGREGLLPEFLLEKPAYRRRYIMTDFQPKCITHGLLKGNTYSIYELLQFTFFGMPLKPAYISWVSKDCAFKPLIMTN